MQQQICGGQVWADIRFPAYTGDHFVQAEPLDCRPPLIRQPAVSDPDKFDVTMLAIIELLSDFQKDRRPFLRYQSTQSKDEDFIVPEANFCALCGSQGGSLFSVNKRYAV